MFSAAKVEFLLVGAYAMAAHGLPRATGDIDLWVRPSPENAARVLLALNHFGAPLQDIQIEDFTQPGIVFQIGVAPRRVDILTQVDGLEFAEAWNSRVTIELEGITVTVLSREHLVRNKRAAGRPKDIADATWLETEI
jgi:hypothetical protein